MTELSYYAANLIINHYLRGISQVFPTTIYMGLSTTVPLRDGTNITEVSASEYDRQPIGSMSVPTVGATANLAEILFIASTTENWGGPQYAVFFDAVSGGNFIGFDPLDFAVGNAIGQRISVPSGDLDISIGSGASYYLANNMINSLWRAQLITAPVGHKLALSTTAVTRSGTGLARPADGTYADKAVTMGAHNNGVTRNIGDALFSNSIPVAWNATHVAILDGSDNILGSVISSYVIGDSISQEVRIAADQLAMLF